MFKLDNLSTDRDGEVPEVYQRCLLLSGKCSSEAALANADGYIKTQVHDDQNQLLFPEQRWPMHHGHFKALVLLSPGRNRVKLIFDHTDDLLAHCTEIVIRYTPLLQTPPLHLAIMIAKDSPLLIDCPPAKFGSVSSAHSSLDAAIAKFRMTAYMWQALTAEDFRAKGLGRRSFRLEEEWTTDTLSQQSLYSPTTAPVPKVHLIRTDKTVAELRDANLAQQNPRANKKDDLHQIFTTALLAHGAPFTSHARPIVAGLILDSHYDLTNTKFILAHAALGCHDPNGLSLGMFGSHLTYAWPRFLDEVPSCLLDATAPGDTVGNDNAECNAMWQACAVGQGAFLHEVGHAFGAPHTEGIMMRGYSPDWPKAFLGCVSAGEGKLEAVTSETKHDCRWGVSDALKFRRLRHFWMPGDEKLSDQAPTVDLGESDDGKQEKMFVEVKCDAGIARVVFTARGKKAEDDNKASVAEPVKSLRYMRGDLAERFGSLKNLGLEVTAMNGRQCSIGNIANLFRNRTYIRVPGTDIQLLKQSVGSRNLDRGHDAWRWAVMLKKRDGEGNLVDASMIDLRVGCGLDGAVVYYKDGERIPCGPRGPKGGEDPHMGGHQARKLALPKDVEITKVAVTQSGCWDLQGLRMWLSNGKAMGALNCKSGGEVEVLVPPANHRVIGFYGTSGSWGMCSRFGIITAPRDAVLPESIYDMEELQNKPKEDSHRDKRRRNEEPENDSDEEMEMGEGSDAGEGCDNATADESCPSEDEDKDYDDGSDSEMERMYQK